MTLHPRAQIPRKEAKGRILGHKSARGLDEFDYALLPMSKRTNKRRLRTKKKANHGKKPNCGKG